MAEYIYKNASKLILLLSRLSYSDDLNRDFFIQVF